MKKSIGIFLILSIIVLGHFYLVKNNGISLDDGYYYSQISGVKEFSDIIPAVQQKFSVIDYRPVATLTFAVEHLMTGGKINPSVSHIINLILYLINCWLLYLWILKLPLKNNEKFIPFIATVLFASLPLHASMVANVKSRDGLLSFLFGIIYLHLILRIFIKKEDNFKKIALLLFSIVAILLAIYSKLDGFNFLLATPILYVIFNRGINFKLILKGFILSLLTYRISTILFEFWDDSKNKAIEFSDATEKSDPILFTENPIISQTNLFDKIAYSIQTVFEYITMIFQPKEHYYYFGYDMLPVLPIDSPLIWLKASILFIILLSALLLFRKNKIYSFSVLFFFISLIYCANLITPVSGIVADRYAYIASMGACIAIAFLLNKITLQILKRFQPQLHQRLVESSSLDINFKSKTSLYFIVPVLCISLFYLPFNIERSKDWKSLFSIFEADLPSITHQSYEANRIATKIYVETAIDTENPILREEYFKKGLQYGTNAMKIYSDAQYVQDGVIMALYGLNDFMSAVDLSRKVIAKFDTTEIGWRMLTEYYYNANLLDSAAIGYRKLIDILPSDPNLYFFYSTTLQQNQQEEQAIQFLDSLISNNPQNYIPFQAKAYLFIEGNDSANAVYNIEKALENGLIDIKLLDYAGTYWWTRDQEKWEYLKKYMPR